MGFGSLVLDKPLAHDHAKGEQFSARPTVSPPASNRPTDPRHPIKPNVDSYDTHQGRWLFVLMARPPSPLILFSTLPLFPSSPLPHSGMRGLPRYNIHHGQRRSIFVFWSFWPHGLEHQTRSFAQRYPLDRPVVQRRGRGRLGGGRIGQIFPPAFAKIR